VEGFRDISDLDRSLHALSVFACTTHVKLRRVDPGEAEAQAQVNGALWHSGRLWTRKGRPEEVPGVRMGLPPGVFCGRCCVTIRSGQSW
jgi:hypothetical protein